MRLGKKAGDALLDVLKRTAVFHRDPRLIEAYHQCEYKRFMAHPVMRGMDVMQMAPLVSGVLALAKSEPPPSVVHDIIEVLNANRTYLLMCDSDELRKRIAAEVDAFYPEYFSAEDIEPTDTAHRSFAFH